MSYEHRSRKYNQQFWFSKKMVIPINNAAKLDDVEIRNKIKEGQRFKNPFNF